MSLYYVVNESAAAWDGSIRFPLTKPCAVYNAWDNRLEAPDMRINNSYTELAVEIEPLKSLIVLFDDIPPSIKIEKPPVLPTGNGINLNEGWNRSICGAIEYPLFKDAKEVSLPDALAEELPGFAGFVRYERHVILDAEQMAKSCVTLEITDAYEGVELFVNGVSAGIQIAPPFRYNISPLIKSGENVFVIEVATTLERQIKPSGFAAIMGTAAPKAPLGITGQAKLYL
jgi:hypothetical protein